MKRPPSSPGVRGAWVLAGLVVLSGCGGSGPTAPPPSTVTFSGTVVSTQSGTPLAGVQVDAAGQAVRTDAAGLFSLLVPAGRTSVTLSGPAILPRVLPVTVGAGASLDAIAWAEGFDLAFYRQLVRNGHESPGALEPLRRWTAAPVFTIAATDDGGAALGEGIVAAVQAAIARTVPLMTGGRFEAGFGPGGVPVRFMRNMPDCGRAVVGPTDAYIELSLSCSDFDRLAAHETGHVLGFWHTDSASDMMQSTQLAAAHPSAREVFHAAIAYRRAPGNRDPDVEQ